MDTSPLDGCLTLKQAARYLRMSESTITRYKRRGLLAFLRVGGRQQIYFREADLRAFVEYVPARVTRLPAERMVRHG